MRVLFLDCFSGISGDMMVGALRDLGVEEGAFRSAVDSLGVGGKIHFHRGSRRGISGWKFQAQADDHSHDDHHEHSHGRNFRQIRALLEESSLSSFVKARSTRRIPTAGCRGKQDSWHCARGRRVSRNWRFRFSCRHCRSLRRDRSSGCRAGLGLKPLDGTGWTDCAHGRFPVPAPATLEILSGLPVRQIEESHELITPTGAALLAEFSSAFGPFPEMKIEKIGYGLGTRDTAPRPNVLRAVLGEPNEAADAEADEIMQIETNIDDLSPELAAAAMERLLAAGALDTFFTAAQMKKGRPGFVLTVLSTEEKWPELARIMLTATTAFGVRMHRTRRLKLKREFRVNETAYRTGAHQAGSSWGIKSCRPCLNTNPACRLPRALT